MAEVTGGGGMGAPSTAPKTTSGGTSILGIPTGGGSEDDVTQGILGTLVSLPKYTSLNDMFNGGGPGAYGDTFSGGPLSGLLNALGVSPVAPTQAEIDRIAALSGGTSGSDSVSRGVSAPAAAPVYVPPSTQARQPIMTPAMPTSPTVTNLTDSYFDETVPGGASYTPGSPNNPVGVPGGGEYVGAGSLPYDLPVYENPTTSGVPYAPNGVYGFDPMTVIDPVTGRVVSATGPTSIGRNGGAGW